MFKDAIRGECIKPERGALKIPFTKKSIPFTINTFIHSSKLSDGQKNKMFFYKLKNPAVLSLLMVCILSGILFFCCRFELPDFYTDRALAEKIIHSAEPHDALEISENLINKSYKIYNFIFQSDLFFCSLLVFCLCFKIFKLNGFFNISVFENKLFVFLWGNISFVVLAYMYSVSYMINMEMYIYHPSADSMSIPLFAVISFFFFISLIYYPLTNILLYITFIKNIKNAFFILIWKLIFIISVLFTLDTFFLKFNYANMFLFFYGIVWIFFSVRKAFPDRKYVKNIKRK